MDNLIMGVLAVMAACAGAMFAGAYGIGLHEVRGKKLEATSREAVAAKMSAWLAVIFSAASLILAFFAGAM